MVFKKGNIPWIKGKKGVIKHSEETKRKMSEGHKGQKPWSMGLTKETDERVRRGADKKRGHSSWNKGKKATEEQRKKMSLAQKGHTPWNKGIPRTQETKDKISKTKTGVKRGPMSEEQKKTLSLIFKGNHPSPFKGKTRPKFSPEWRKNISDSKKGIYKGENNPNWRGGISFEPYGKTFNKELKKRIIDRDNHKCFLCEVGKIKNRHLVAHHIDYDKTNNASKNLITLCRPCHMKTNFNRDCWQNFFNELMFFVYPPQTNIYSTNSLKV